MLKGFLSWLLSFIFKVCAAMTLSVLTYFFVLKNIHLEFYAYQHRIKRNELWAGDGFGLALETILIFSVEFILFWYFISFIQKKFK